MKATRVPTPSLSFGVVLLIFASSLVFAQSNPLPLINQPLVPATIKPGGGDVTLTVNGTGFISGAVVKWNGSPLATTFVTASQLRAIVPAADTATPSTGWVTVVNPGVKTYPPVAYLPVRTRSSKVSMQQDTHSNVPGGSIGVGDFNNDRKLDIAVGQPGYGGLTKCPCITTFLNQGNETFRPSSRSSDSWLGNGSPVVEPVYTGDFNNDGFLDVIGGDDDSNNDIFLGRGNGKFAYENYVFRTLQDSFYVSTADFNGDGNLDVFAAGVDASGTELPYFQIFLGDGAGHFTPGQQVQNLQSVGFPAIGDFNGDGILDFVETNYDPQTRANQVQIYFGNGDGTFQNPITYSVKNPHHALAAADVNGDGILDIVTDGVDVLLGKGDGSFTEVSGNLTLWNLYGNSYKVEVADMNGDGKPDLVLDAVNGYVAEDPQNILVMLGNGNGTFQSPIVFPAGNNIYASVGMEVADFDNSGKLGVAVSSDTISNGPGPVYIFLQK